jgi:hypothetical protein
MQQDEQTRRRAVGLSNQCAKCKLSYVSLLLCERTGFLWHFVRGSAHATTTLRRRETRLLCLPSCRAVLKIDRGLREYIKHGASGRNQANQAAGVDKKARKGPWKNKATYGWCFRVVYKGHVRVNMGPSGSVCLRTTTQTHHTHLPYTTRMNIRMSSNLATRRTFPPPT